MLETFKATGCVQIVPRIRICILTVFLKHVFLLVFVFVFVLIFVLVFVFVFLFVFVFVLTCRAVHYPCISKPAGGKGGCSKLLTRLIPP